jgi:hypothetical protein
MIDRLVTLAAAGFVIAGQYGDAFQQGGFAGAVFTDDDGDGPIETQLERIGQERQAERIGGAVGNPRWLEPDPPEIRRGQIDRAVSSGGHAPAPQDTQRERNRNIRALEVGIWPGVSPESGTPQSKDIRR